MAQWHKGLRAGLQTWALWMEAVPRLRLELLSGSTPASRRGLLLRNPTRFANPALVQELADSARAVVRTDPHAASRLAALAVRVVTISLPGRVPEFLVRELGLEAAAVGANAQRVLGNLGAADRVLSALVAQLDQVGDPGVRLEVFSYAASLRKDQRRFGEAEGYLASALRICRALGDRRKELRLLLKRASIAFHRGQVGEALRRNRQVLRRGLEARDDEVCEWASHNLALCLLELERFAEATAWLEGNRARFGRKGDSAARLRWLWLEARLSAGLGRRRHAEGRYLLLRQAYLARELPYEVALVTLDLAALWAEQGRFEEVVELAAASAAVFASLHLDREVLAAIASIAEAAQARDLDLARLRGTRRALEKAVPWTRARSRGERP